MPNSAIYNASNECIGYLALIDGAVVALDLDGRELGRFSNSLEAASTVLRAWRQGEAAPERTVEQAAEAQRDFWASVRASLAAYYGQRHSRRIARRDQAQAERNPEMMIEFD
jgi:hypothetical protein